MATHENPYDGHITLKDALRQIQRIVRLPEQVFVDKGYRGHSYEDSTQVHVESYN